MFENVRCDDLIETVTYKIRHELFVFEIRDLEAVSGEDAFSVTPHSFYRIKFTRIAGVEDQFNVQEIICFLDFQSSMHPQLIDYQINLLSSSDSFPQMLKEFNEIELIDGFLSH